MFLSKEPQQVSEQQAWQQNTPSTNHHLKRQLTPVTAQTLEQVALMHIMQNVAYNA